MVICEQPAVMLKDARSCQYVSTCFEQIKTSDIAPLRSTLRRLPARQNLSQLSVPLNSTPRANGHINSLTFLLCCRQSHCHWKASLAVARSVWLQADDAITEVWSSFDNCLRPHDVSSCMVTFIFCVYQRAITYAWSLFGTWGFLMHCVLAYLPLYHCMPTLSYLHCG